jgi:hypothetical protein
MCGENVEMLLFILLCQARVLFRDIVAAVLHCHRRGVVHRDLNPSQILISADYNLKLAVNNVLLVVYSNIFVSRTLATRATEPHGAQGDS